MLKFLQQNWGTIVVVAVIAAIVAAIVDAFGGQIKVAADNGTTFTVTLPAADQR